MDCRTWRRQLAAWLERSDAAGQQARIPPELAEHAAGCRDCAVRLRAAQRLLAPAVVPVPADLSERVWARLQRERAGARRPAPAPQRWLAVAAMVAIAAAGGFVVARVGRDVVHVRLAVEAPGARQVSVVGDWNEWSPESDRLLDRDGDGVWEGTVRLQRLREYRYQFLIDGEQWIPDPQAPVSIDDGFGGRSSVLQL